MEKKNSDLKVAVWNTSPGIFWSGSIQAAQKLKKTADSPPLWLSCIFNHAGDGEQLYLYPLSILIVSLWYIETQILTLLWASVSASQEKRLVSSAANCSTFSSPARLLTLSVRCLVLCRKHTVDLSERVPPLKQLPAGHGVNRSPCDGARTVKLQAVKNEALNWVRLVRSVELQRWLQVRDHSFLLLPLSHDKPDWCRLQDRFILFLLTSHMFAQVSPGNPITKMNVS